MPGPSAKYNHAIAFNNFLTLPSTDATDRRRALEEQLREFEEVQHSVNTGYLNLDRQEQANASVDEVGTRKCSTPAPGCKAEAKL